MHYAVHGHTAAKLIVKRADHTKEHVGVIRKAPIISDRCFNLFLYLYLYAFIKSAGVIAGTSEFSKSLTLQVIM